LRGKGGAVVGGAKRIAKKRSREKVVRVVDCHKLVRYDYHQGNREESPVIMNSVGREERIPLLYRARTSGYKQSKKRKKKVG